MGEWATPSPATPGQAQVRRQGACAVLAILWRALPSRHPGQEGEAPAAAAQGIPTDLGAVDCTAYLRFGARCLAKDTKRGLCKEIPKDAM